MLLNIAVLSIIAIVIYLAIGMIVVKVIDELEPKAGLRDDKFEAGLMMLLWPFVPFVALIGYTVMFFGWLYQKVNGVFPTIMDK